MPETSSETIAQRARKKIWTGKIIKIVVITTVVFGVLLVIFFDPKALALSFGFIVAAVLFVIFTVGAGKKPDKSAPGHYSGQFSQYNMGKTSPLPGYKPPGKRESGERSPYTSAEGYQALIDSYQQKSKTGGGSRDPKQHTQPHLGANMSNTAMIALLFAAVIAIWIFA